MYRILLIIVVFALSSVSCGNERDDIGDTVGLRIIADIGSGDTRALITGTAFTLNQEVGFIVLGSQHAYRNEGLPHLDGYGNIRALKKSGTEWSYFLYNGLDIGSAIPGMPSYGKVNIYGYYPYDPDFTAGGRFATPYIPGVAEDDRFKIPYFLGAIENGYVTTTGDMVETDYMYAMPKIDYELTGQPASMSFHHAMTCIEFYIYNSYAGPGWTLATIDFSIDDESNRKFAVSGTCDISTGEVTRETETKRILVHYNKSLRAMDKGDSNNEIQCFLIFPSLEYDEYDAEKGDATITATLRFTEQDEGLDFNNAVNKASTSFKFKLSDINQSGMRGLCAGLNYKYRIIIQNFVKYNGVPIIVYPDWENDQEDMLPNII